MRRVVVLAAGLVVSTLLLGGGWLWATHRERVSRISEARERFSHAADAVRAAVDESLEELRVREHQRQFYLYNHYYSPPDVLAITDPVATSPLAHRPRDARIRGYFQIEPGGGIRTPYTPDGAPDPPRAAQLRAVIEHELFASMRALASGDERGTMLAPPGLIERPRVAPPPSPGGLLEMRASAEQAQAASPLTIQMNQYGNVQAQDIQAAQAGDLDANARVIQRGRQVPIISRRDVSWAEAERASPSNMAQQQQGSATSAGSRPMAQASTTARRVPRPSRAAVRSLMEEARTRVEECTIASPLTVRLTLRGNDGRVLRTEVEGTSETEEVRCVREALSRSTLAPFGADSVLVRYAFRGAPDPELDPLLAAVPSDLGLDNFVRREAEVDYTPMAFRQVGSELVLHRLVSHGGATIVQGVLLDRRELLERWIPNVARRRADRGAAPSVVEAGGGECAVRRPASDVVPDVELCIAPAALARATADIDAELGWQLGALLSLWLMASLAAAAIVSAARRAEALSKQKSAFVSAVSHELRTPLTTLRMHAEMLEEGLVTEERRPKVHAELVRESVRLARLVDNVLSLSKLEEGRRRIHPAEGDLRAHVREVVEGQRRFVGERGFALRGPEDDEPLEARFDAQAVEQIVVNLLDNAVKYGGGEERAIEADVVTIGGAPTLVVRDRGPGIPENERRKVFERFHRVEREETAHAPGTGIGLALVAELAHAHGGAASVHPREGGGLEVRVRFGAPRSSRAPRAPSSR